MHSLIRSRTLRSVAIIAAAGSLTACSSPNLTAALESAAARDDAARQDIAAHDPADPDAAPSEASTFELAAEDSQRALEEMFEAIENKRERAAQPQSNDARLANAGIPESEPQTEPSVYVNAAVTASAPVANAGPAIDEQWPISAVLPDVSAGAPEETNAAPDSPQAEQLNNAAFALLESADAASDPLALALRLRALIAAGASSVELTARYESLLDELAPDEAAIVRAFEATTAPLVTSDADSSPVDLTKFASQLESGLNELSTERPLEISDFQICRAVEGFGQTTPFHAMKFPAGRTIRAVAYVEANNFQHREALSPHADPSADGATPDPWWEIELAVDLELYHDSEASPTLQWRMGERSAKDVSKRARRDHFIATVIELPRTLTLGRYRLKAILRDRVSGRTAEATLAFQVTASEGLRYSP